MKMPSSKKNCILVVSVPLELIRSTRLEWTRDIDLAFSVFMASGPASCARGRSIVAAGVSKRGEFSYCREQTLPSAATETPLFWEAPCTPQLL